MKQIFLFLIAVHLFGATVHITADRFSADENQGFSTFDGHVRITKDLDRLLANRVTVFFDKQRKPISYEANGNVEFNITTKESHSYYGKANKVLYYPNEQHYKFYGNVTLRQLNDKKVVQGEEVFINIAKGTASVKGGKNRPVKMVFDFEEKGEK